MSEATPAEEGLLAPAAEVMLPGGGEMQLRHRQRREDLRVAAVDLRKVEELAGVL